LDKQISKNNKMEKKRERDRQYYLARKEKKGVEKMEGESWRKEERGN